MSVNPEPRMHHYKMRIRNVIQDMSILPALIDAVQKIPPTGIRIPKAIVINAPKENIFIQQPLAIAAEKHILTTMMEAAGMVPSKVHHQVHHRQAPPQQHRIQEAIIVME